MSFLEGVVEGVIYMGVFGEAFSEMKRPLVYL